MKRLITLVLLVGFVALTVQAAPRMKPLPWPHHYASGYYKPGDPNWEQLRATGYQHVIVQVSSNPDYWDYRDVPLKPGGYVRHYPPVDGADLDLWCRDAVRDVGKCEKWEESDTLGQEIQMWGMWPIIFCGCDVGDPNSGRAYQ